jgi:hypothetical protein
MYSLQLSVRSVRSMRGGLAGHPLDWDGHGHGRGVFTLATGNIESSEYIHLRQKNTHEHTDMSAICGWQP